MPATTKNELKVGEKAPAFTSKDQNGNKVSLSDFKGKWVVLYFYPKDDTPGCTIEAEDFTQYLPGFKKIDAEILGVSKDSCESHQKFIKKKNLKIILLSDEQKELCQSYGVWRPKKFMGREFLGINRSTFLIDPNGTLAHIWPKVSPKGHAEEVQDKIKELAGG